MDPEDFSTEPPLEDESCLYCWTVATVRVGEVPFCQRHGIEVLTHNLWDALERKGGSKILLAQRAFARVTA